MRNALLFVLTLFVAGLCVGAEVYPSKPVRVLVSVGPGSTADLIARVISQQLSEQLGKSFVVDNRVGASGVIANGIVAKGAPDGYTLAVMDITSAIVPGLNKSLPYDPLKDFGAITLIVRSQQVLVVNPALNVNTLKEFIALAQANPGKFNYGSGGVGSPIHLFSELFKIAANVNIVHIPYKGDRLTALRRGEIQMNITSIQNVLAPVKSGQVRALAVLTDGKRLASMPDVPSMSEAGVSGMAVYSWDGLMGPAGMPKEVVNKLYAGVVKALAVPSVKERLTALDTELVGSGPEEFSIYFRNEIRRWTEVIKSAGITPE
jgi:tripartite-type tricarboxylate transporter receptor subunit TctC